MQRNTKQAAAFQEPIPSKEAIKIPKQDKQQLKRDFPELKFFMNDAALKIDK